MHGHNGKARILFGHVASVEWEDAVALGHIWLTQKPTPPIDTVSKELCTWDTEQYLPEHVFSSEPDCGQQRTCHWGFCSELRTSIYLDSIFALTEVEITFGVCACSKKERKKTKQTSTVSSLLVDRVRRAVSKDTGANLAPMPAWGTAISWCKHKFYHHLWSLPSAASIIWFFRHLNVAWPLHHHPHHSPPSRSRHFLHPTCYRAPSSATQRYHLTNCLYI